MGFTVKDALPLTVRSPRGRFPAVALQVQVSDGPHPHPFS